MKHNNHCELTKNNAKICIYIHAIRGWASSPETAYLLETAFPARHCTQDGFNKPPITHRKEYENANAFPNKDPGDYIPLSRKASPPEKLGEF